MHVVLGVAAVGAEREQLHHLAAVVLVGAVLVVLRARQPQQHRRVARHLHQQVVEVAQRPRAHHPVLAEHERRGRAVDGGGKPAVPDERHALHELMVGPDHAVQPPAVIVAPDVDRVQREPVVAVRRPADEPRAALRARQRGHRPVQAECGQPPRVAAAGAEPGAPQQPRGVALGEATAQGRDRGAGYRGHVDVRAGGRAAGRAGPSHNHGIGSLADPLTPGSPAPLNLREVCPRGDPNAHEVRKRMRLSPNPGQRPCAEDRPPLEQT